MNANLDQMTLAYLNMNAVLGAVPYLCELTSRAPALLEGKDCAIGLSVRGGPEATLRFTGGRCVFEQGCERCDVKLPFSTPEKFNALIDGTGKAIPSRGFTKIPFLLGPFTKLTDLLSSYLRPREEDLADDAFFETSTTLMLHVIAGAIAEIGNHDHVGQVSASYIVDGVIRIAIDNGPAVGLRADNHRLTAIHTDPKPYLSYMSFCDLRLARALFDGKVNAVSCVGEGKVRIGGMVSQIDNVNRILDRVALYLA